MTALEYLEIENKELIKRLEKNLLRGEVTKIMTNFAIQYHKEQLAAINYTRCCNKLKDKKAMNFEEWVDFEGHRDYYNDLVDNGFAYDIEKFYKRYVEAVKPSL